MSFYIHPTPKVTVFFGSADHAFIPADFKASSSKSIVHHKVFAGVAQAMGLEQIVFLHQTHSVVGAIINGTSDHQVFIQEGDFLITSSKKIGIAVATADCIPLVLYSTQYPVVGIVHAGWRGTVGGIVTKALDSFITKIEHQDKKEVIQTLRVIIGPAARVCCYQVTADFVDNLLPDYRQFIEARESTLFFDGVGYNKRLLQEYGVPTVATTDTGICTMHKSGYCSHRASGGSPERNYTLVALK